MTAAVHTCAPDAETDLFAGTDAAPPQHLLAEIDGKLIEAAQVRSRPAGHDGRMVLVLCLDMRPLNGARRSIHAEIVYREADRKLAEQKAATLPRGARVTVTTTFEDMRTVLPHGQGVVLIPSH